MRWNVFFVAKFNRVICDVALFPEENMFPNFFTFGPLRCHFKNHLFKNSQKSSFNNISPNFENHNISVLEDDLLNTNLEKIASFIYFPDLQKCLSTFKKEFGIAHLYTHYHTYDQVLGLKWSHRMYILVLSSLILPKLKFLFMTSHCLRILKPSEYFNLISKILQEDIYSLITAERKA